MKRTIMQSLIHEATKTAKRQGHVVKVIQDWKHQRRIGCSHCSMTADIKGKPQPNEINIGGELIALRCPNPRQRRSLAGDV